MHQKYEKSDLYSLGIILLQFNCNRKETAPIWDFADSLVGGRAHHYWTVDEAFAGYRKLRAHYSKNEKRIDVVMLRG